MRQKLYRKAKREPRFRFYALYDRIQRMLQGRQSYFSQGHLIAAYRDVDSYPQRRLMAHLRRRSQRAYKKPTGVTWWDHLHRLGWPPLQMRVVKT